MDRGLIQVYTGDGKGKTTAALGAALRATGQGYSVAFFQFLKAGKTGESAMARLLGWDFRQFATGRWFIETPPDEQETDLALAGLQAAFAAVRQKDVVILDEISHALNTGLISKEAFLPLLEAKPASCELILTGRRMPDFVLERADLITEMRLVKHPWDKGVKARRGIEF